MKKRILSLILIASLGISNVTSIFANQLSNNETSSIESVSPRISNEEHFAEYGGKYVTNYLTNTKETCFVASGTNNNGVDFWYYDGSLPEISVRVTNSKGKTVHTYTFGRGFLGSISGGLANGEKYSVYISNPERNAYGNWKTTICYTTK